MTSPADSQFLALFQEAAAHTAEGRFRQAIRVYRQAIALRPDVAAARSNLGRLLLDLGRHGPAVSQFREACLRAGPASPVASNYLLSTQYLPQARAEAVAGLHRWWGSHFPESEKPAKRKRRGRWRIGFLSPDFHFHPHAFLYVPHFRHFDRDRFELFLYHSSPFDDAYTEQARASAEHWRDVHGLTAAAAAELIRSDGVDLLVDITGHFARSPLPVFAQRAAPVQVSIAGYPGTTGLPAMDYKLVDPWTDPPASSARLYCEQLHYLERPIACYAPPAEAPEPGPLPALTNGYVTFGCFNNRPKLNGPLFELWVRILHALPSSRLLFHHTYNGGERVSAEFRDPIVRFFRKRGIPSRRLSFVGGQPLAQHFRTVARADIALDSFPYHGYTTTFETLWMGVPVVVRASGVNVSGIGVSILTAAGLPDWIAHDDEAYVAAAVHQAGDLEALSRLRGELRGRLATSSLTDSAGYARSLERVFEELLER